MGDYPKAVDDPTLGVDDHEIIEGEGSDEEWDETDDQAQDDWSETNANWTPLHFTAYQQDVEAVKTLLRDGANIDALDTNGDTPLHIAAVDPNGAEIVKALIDGGASIDLVDGQRCSALLLAAEHGNLATAVHLLDAGADIDKTGFADKSVLHWTVEPNHSDLLKLFLDRGASTPGFDNKKCTALHRAVEYDNSGAVTHLLDAGADINQRGFMGESPLHTAVEEANVPMIKMLLDRGASTDTYDENGHSPLILAAARGFNDCILAFLGAGVDVNEKDPRGHTAVFQSIRYSHVETVDLLLSKGADPLLLDQFGRNSYDWVRMCCFEDGRKPALPEPVITPDPETASAARKATICRLVATIKGVKVKQGNKPILSDELIDSYEELGHLLLLHGNEDDSRSAFDLQMPRKGQALDFYCQACDFKYPGKIEMTAIIEYRYICSTCTGMDLCEACMKLYEQNGGKVDMKSFEACKGHKFLKVWTKGTRLIPLGQVNKHGEIEDQWLDRLLDTYRTSEDVRGC